MSNLYEAQIELVSFLKKIVYLRETLKMAVFWDVAPCSLVETDSKSLWNVGQFLQNYTARTSLKTVTFILVAERT
jgi:hypothetical protein